MSVPEQTTFTSSTANGVTTVFPYGFMVASEDDLVVELDGVVQTTGFSVSGVGVVTGGDVTFLTPPANGAKVLRYRDPQLSRPTDYQQFGDLPASVLNLDFDRVWLALQSLVARSDRSIKLPVDTATEQLIRDTAAQRAGKLIGFDASGNVIIYAAADVGLSVVSAFISTLLDDISAAQARSTLGLDFTKQTVWIPAAAFTPRTTNGAAPGTVESATNKIMFKTLDFDAATAEYAQFAVRMPKSWNEGTITATFLWSNASGTGNVRWAIQGVAVSDDDVLDAAFGTAVAVLDGVTAAGDLMQSAETAAVTVAGTPQPGDLVTFQIYRDAADGTDTLAVDARLHGVALFYSVDALTDA